MSGHLLDQQPEERLFAQIKELQDQVKELRTAQNSASDTLPFTVYPGISTSYNATFTLGANAQQTTTIALRENAAGPMIHEPALTVHVDTDDADHRWQDGGFLTSAQRKIFYSVTRNWEVGLVPQDPLNNAVWQIQLWNLDSAAHIYYLHFKFYGHAGLLPLVAIT